MTSLISAISPYHGTDQSPFCTTPVSIDSLERVLGELFEMMSHQESVALDQWRLAITSERAWREALSQRLEEAQIALQRSISIQGGTATVADIIRPLCLVAEGVASLCSRGIEGPSLAALAMGGVLTIDALTGHQLRGSLAKVLQRISGEDQEQWAARIATTCAVGAVAAGIGLPGGSSITIAAALSQGTIEISKAGARWSSDQQQALCLETEAAWDRSGYTMSELLELVQRSQVSSREDSQDLMALHQSTSRTIQEIFS